MKREVLVAAMLLMTWGATSAQAARADDVLHSDSLPAFGNEQQSSQPCQNCLTGGKQDRDAELRRLAEERRQAEMQRDRDRGRNSQGTPGNRENSASSSRDQDRLDEQRRLEAEQQRRRDNGRDDRDSNGSGSRWNDSGDRYRYGDQSNDRNGYGYHSQPTYPNNGWYGNQQNPNNGWYGNQQNYPNNGWYGNQQNYPNNDPWYRNDNRYQYPNNGGYRYPDNRGSQGNDNYWNRNSQPSSGSWFDWLFR